ncbi:MAG: hypothetical protein H7A35_05445 [Planctomycetales bacterium]|nr:hypothetical protein [bacterium]UNM09502.1 MAG: hypothetical protein H7A35_05445 [Planctomycetales bacterium]
MSTSRIRIWQSQSDHLTLSGSAVRPKFSRPFREASDLYGLVHRLESGEQAWVVQLELELWPFQLSIANSAAATTRLCVADWLERAYLQRSELVIFSEFTGEATDGISISRDLAWRGSLTALPEGIAADLGMQADNGLPHIALFHVVEDGSFANFDSVGSYTAASPARPWTE